MADGKDDCIQVVVRCRPFNRKEKEENRSNIIEINGEARSIQINNLVNPNESKSYTFDGVYDENTIQKFFYEDCCFQLVENVLEGFNGTVFAYGQTGCGKSYTMQGPRDAGPDGRGVIPNSFSHIFDTVKASTEVEYLIHCSYLEIYQEEIKDLLAEPSKAQGKSKATKCDLKEDPQKGVFVKNLTDVMVKNEEELSKVLERGVALRTVAETKMNDESSRSHSIFTIVIEMSSKDPHTGKEQIKVGKLNLVDLAGSERQKKTGASGAVLKEGAKINLSLSALGNVISALSDAKSKGHVPYRDSKLTRLLQDSLGGNTKTLMVAAISPADYNYDETLSTLRYANRAKNIQNKPKINEDPKDTMMRELREQVEALKKQLEAGGGGAGAGASVGVASGGGESNENLDAILKEKDAMGEALAEERRRAEDMARQMAELQEKLVGHAHTYKGATSPKASPVKGGEGSSDGGEDGAPAFFVEEAQTEEQIEAARRLKERRKEAKRKREAKRKQALERAKAEKDAMEEELEDLRISAQGALGQAAQSADEIKEEARRKMVKLKRRYEKKLSASRAEVDDIIEEASYQRNQLLDTLREQEKDCRLYEAICLAVMSEQELQKMVSKARYDEDDEYWVIPFTKRKSFDNPDFGGGGVGMGMGMGAGGGAQQPLVPLHDSVAPRRGSRDNGSFPTLGGGGTSSNNGRLPSASGAAGAGAGAGGGVADEYGEISFQSGSAFAGEQYGGGSSVAVMDGANMGGFVDMSSAQVLPSSVNSRGGGGGGSLLPNLHNKGAGFGNANAEPSFPMTAGEGASGGTGGGGLKPSRSKKDLTPEEREARAQKKAAKHAKRAAKEQARIERMKAEQANVMYSDEAGTGEQAENTMEWEWAAGSAAGADPSDNPQYSDDEDFEVDEPPSSGRRGGSESGGGGGGGNDGRRVMAVPPIQKGGGGANRGGQKKKGGGGGTLLPAL